jgi:hypothetical protein
MGGADRQARRAAVRQIEIDKFAEGLLERFGGVVSRSVGAKRIIGPGMRQRIGLKETGNSIRYRRPKGQFFIEAGKYPRETPDRALLHPPPEFAQSRQAVVRYVAGNQARINSADRCADDPVRLDPRLMQRLIDTGLIRAQRTATLQYENDLPGKRPVRRFEVLRRLIIPDVIHVTPPTNALRAQ